MSITVKISPCYLNLTAIIGHQYTITNGDNMHTSVYDRKGKPLTSPKRHTAYCQHSEEIVYAMNEF